MCDILPSGTVIGPLLPEICEETGLKPVEIIAPACHDTASAVAAVPAKSPNWAYLSSGTWSLMGIEVDEPIITKLSLQNNFTNEGGVNNKIRFLRNNMGMWLLERCRYIWKQEGNLLTYEELVNLAKNTDAFKCFIDPDDSSFLNPNHMPSAIRNYCSNTKQSLPETKGEIVRCIFESLALKYRYILEMINSMQPNKVEFLHIVGGGSQNEMLNQFTANALGIPVIAGPVEATALGNIMVQAIANGIINNIEEGRQLIAKSFPLKTYQPNEHSRWIEFYQKAKKLFKKS
jgi:rhamnulokinase